MCSFIFSTNTVVDLDKIITFNRRRGPDLTVRYKYHNYEFIHNLLSITGEFTKQPLIDDEYITLFNGEIYNYKDINKAAKSDVYSIPSGFKEKGIKSFENLDGEFSILLYDIKENIIYICTDIFGTKPLYLNANFESRKELMLSTYASVLRYAGHSNIKRVMKIGVLDLVKL